MLHYVTRTTPSVEFRSFGSARGWRSQWPPLPLPNPVEQQKNSVKFYSLNITIVIRKNTGSLKIFRKTNDDFLFRTNLDHTLVGGDGRWSARWRFTARMRLDVWEARRLGSSPPCRTSEAAFFTIFLAEPHWWLLINSFAFRKKKCHSLQEQKTF